MPLPKSKMKLTLSEIDAPEYWVEFRLLYGMKYSEVKRLFGEDKDDDKPDSEYVEEMMSKLVIDWNLPEEDGGPILPLPSEDPTSIGRLPNSVVSFLIEKISAPESSEVPVIENLKVP